MTSAEQLREEGRQEIRNAVTKFRNTKAVECYPDYHDWEYGLYMLDQLRREIAPKSRRYIVAPAGYTLAPDEEWARFKGQAPVYLKPGWTKDVQCRATVATLLRSGVEVREA